MAVKSTVLIYKTMIVSYFDYGDIIYIHVLKQK